MPTIYGDGEQTRDFVFVSDVVEANIRAVTEKGCTGQFFNIACAHKISLNRLLKTLCELYEVELNGRYEEARRGDIKHSYANIDKAGTLLNWSPRIELKEGLSRLI